MNLAIQKNDFLAELDLNTSTVEIFLSKIFFFYLRRAAKFAVESVQEGKSPRVKIIRHLSQTKQRNRTINDRRIGQIEE